MKRFWDDDSAATSVKVVYRQASYIEKAHQVSGGLFCFGVPLLSRRVCRIDAAFMREK